VIHILICLISDYSSGNGGTTSGVNPVNMVGRPGPNPTANLVSNS